MLNSTRKNRCKSRIGHARTVDRNKRLIPAATAGVNLSSQSCFSHSFFAVDHHAGIRSRDHSHRMQQPQKFWIAANKISGYLVHLNLLIHPPDSPF